MLLFEPRSGSISPCLPHFLPATLRNRQPAYIGHSNTDYIFNAVYMLNNISFPFCLRRLFCSLVNSGVALLSVKLRQDIFVVKELCWNENERLADSCDGFWQGTKILYKRQCGGLSERLWAC